MTHTQAITEAYNAVNGEGSAMTAYAKLHAIKLEVEAAMDAVKESAIEERRKYGKERIERSGFEIELAQGRKVWSYKHASAWANAEAERKRIEKMMQTAYETGAEIIDKETGEVYEPASLSFASDTIRLTFKP